MSKESKYRAPQKANLPPTYEVPEEIDFGELCRRVIADPTSTALDKFRAMDRLRQMEREQQSHVTEEPDLASEYADQTEALGRAIELALESGLFDSIPAYRESIERRAVALVEEREANSLERRSQLAVLDAPRTQDAPVAEEQGEQPAETPETPRDAPGAPGSLVLQDDRPLRRRRREPQGFGGFPPSRSRG